MPIIGLSFGSSDHSLQKLRNERLGDGCGVDFGTWEWYRTAGDEVSKSLKLFDIASARAEFNPV